MRIYPRGDVSAISDPRYPDGFTADADGSFDLPEEVATLLLTSPTWETTSQRDDRLVSEELERRRDPASLYEEIRALRQGSDILAPGVTANDLRAQAAALAAQADVLEAQISGDTAAAGEAERQRAAAEVDAQEETERKERVEQSGQLGAGDVPPQVNGHDHEAEDKHADGYDALDVLTLRKMAKERDVTQAGRKDELITRIRAFDQEHAEKPGDPEQVAEQQAPESDSTPVE